MFWPLCISIEYIEVLVSFKLDASDGRDPLP